MNNQNSMLLFSIMPLDEQHTDEICEDIKYQYENGITTCPLFSMTLVPEGNPPVDKVGKLCEKYAIFKKKLDNMGIPSGILVQATIGHGWVLSEMFPYQQYIGLSNGEPKNTVCPADDGFKEYIKHVFSVIAAQNPAHIMVDDDYRLMFRPEGGCGCPKHIERFNKALGGTSFTRKEAWELVSSSSSTERKKYSSVMAKIQIDSLVETAKIMRAGIDSVNSKIPGSFCCCGNNAEGAPIIAEILAGKGNPTVVRINNGNYTAAGPRGFSKHFLRAANQIAKLKNNTDIILAETDTCPQNRYSTGAMSLHTHFTGTILEGARGAKHWITRLECYEPESGTAYRRVLAKHRNFYEVLANLVPTLSWRGFRIPVSNKQEFVFDNSYNVASDGSDGWSNCVFERFGLPMYYGTGGKGIVCLDGNSDKNFSDDEILSILKKSVFLASDTAQNLINRGFGEYLGVEVREWNGKTPTKEMYLVGKIRGNTSNVQVKTKELVIKNDTVVVDSMVYHSVDKVNKEFLFPGVTMFKNSIGGTVFVFSGTPKARYNLTEAFSFLNSSRKKQLTALMQAVNELPAYYPGDEETYFRVADMTDGGLFCALFNLGCDPIDKVELVCEKDIKEIYCLTPNGNKTKVDFTTNNERLTLDHSCGVLDPQIFFLYD